MFLVWMPERDQSAVVSVLSLFGLPAATPSAGNLCVCVCVDFKHLARCYMSVRLFVCEMRSKMKGFKARVPERGRLKVDWSARSPIFNLANIFDLSWNTSCDPELISQATDSITDKFLFVLSSVSRSSSGTHQNKQGTVESQNVPFFEWSLVGANFGFCSFYQF